MDKETVGLVGSNVFDKDWYVWLRLLIFGQACMVTYQGRHLNLFFITLSTPRTQVRQPSHNINSWKLHLNKSSHQFCGYFCSCWINLESVPAWFQYVPLYGSIGGPSSCLWDQWRTSIPILDKDALGYIFIPRTPVYCERVKGHATGECSF